MKALLAGIVGLGLGYFLSDFQPVDKAINEAFRVGTVRGVDECIQYSSTELLSDTAVRDSCAREFRKPIFEGDAATGRAGPRIEREVVSLQGNLENKVPGFVTTWVELTLTAYDAEGAEKEFKAELTTWIEPLSSTEFSVEMEEAETVDIEGLLFCPDEQETRVSCISWGTTAISGVYLR